jgi:HD-GYP domain-containing protein (c-di-GMP phosphodiesterase class II)
MKIFNRIKALLDTSLEVQPEIHTELDAPEINFEIPDLALDPDLQAIMDEGKPIGVPFAESVKQQSLTNRTAAYKTETGAKYRTSTERVKGLFQALNRGDRVAASSIQTVVLGFLHLLRTDKNILLNLSYLPSSPEDYLYSHSVNVSLLSMAVASGSGYSETQVRDIATSALLIDVGMMRVPEIISSKSGPLDPSELFEIRKHPIVGADIMSVVEGLPVPAMLAIYQHHERLCGTGYPKKRSGHLIHEYSRIIAISDIYAAMVANRNYRKRLLPYNAMTAIIKMGSEGQLDPALIRRFLETMSLFPLGSLVRLESGAIGKIIHSNPASYAKPTLYILKAGTDGRTRADSVLDLSLHGGDKIVAALDEGELGIDPMRGF